MPGNLVQNGGFETGDFSNWAVTGTLGSDIGVDSYSDDVNSGNFGAFAGNASTTSLGQTIATVVGASYTVSFYLDVYQADATDGFFNAAFGGQTVTALSEPSETDAFVHYTATITATSTSSLLEFSFKDPGGYFGLDDVSVVQAACYAAGTYITTTRGEVAIETLAVGDTVVTTAGQERQIRWLGHRLVETASHAVPQDVWPVCVSKYAFGDNAPARDLWLSPGHKVLVEGVLIPIKLLLNGRTVAQHERASIAYWHLELDEHDIVLAENMPAETYLDTGNRSAFVGGRAFMLQHPGLVSKRSDETCAQLVKTGPEVVRAKAGLLARAKERGHQTTTDADLHVLADGRRIEPISLGKLRLAFVVPPGCESIRLISRASIPAQTQATSTDTRSLGVCVKRLQIDGLDQALHDDRTFRDGWHRFERREGEVDRRWTSGVTPLPAETQLVVIELAKTNVYWKEPTDNVVALFG